MANLPNVKGKGKISKKPIDEIIPFEPEGGQYPTQGGPTPKSSQVQMWANEKNISLQVMETDKNAEKAWSRVRAIIAETGQYVEAQVVLRYDDVEQRTMINQVEKLIKESGIREGETILIKDMAEPLILTNDGRVVANYTTRGLMDFMKKMVNYRYTAERVAETMAGKRAQWKILNKEWKDEFETEGEQLEDETEDAPIDKSGNTEEKPKEQPKKANKVRTFDKPLKTQKQKEEEAKQEQELKNGERTQEREAEEKPKEEKTEEPKEDVKKGVSEGRKPIKRVTRKKQETIDTDMFPPTRPKEEYKEVAGKEIIGMIREDLKQADLVQDMNNISVLLRALKQEKKISPHQFRVANEYNMDMNF